jgi:hypothetical protein
LLWLDDGNLDATLLQCRKSVWRDVIIGNYLVDVVDATYTAKTTSAEL